MGRTVGSEGARTEDAIRRAAIDLIAERGFASVTLRDLASRVGLQAGSLYRYFPSKDELLFRIMIEHMRAVLAGWEAARPDTDDPRTRLDAFIDFHVRYHSQKQREVFIGNMEMRSLTPDHRKVVVALRSLYEDELHRILANGVEAKVFRTADTRIATFAILAMLTGLTAWYREGGRPTAHAIAEVYRALIFEGLTPQRQGGGRALAGAQKLP